MNEIKNETLVHDKKPEGLQHDMLYTFRETSLLQEQVQSSYLKRKYKYIKNNLSG